MKRNIIDISCEAALDFYSYNKSQDILSLEIISKEILCFETEYEKKHTDLERIILYFVIDIPSKQYDKISYKIEVSLRRHLLNNILFKHSK